MMTTIFLDIEAIPPQDRQPDPLTVKVPVNYKKEDAIKKYQEDHAEEAYRKLALSKLDAQVIVISAAINDEKPIVIAYDDERKVMEEFDRWLESVSLKGYLHDFYVCGHNVIGYDAPILYLRACKYDLHFVKQLIPTKPYDERWMDTMRMAAPMLRSEYISMDVLLKFFNLGDKGDIDGSMVYDMFLEGKLNEIATYCQEDVIKTRKIYNKLK